MWKTCDQPVTEFFFQNFNHKFTYFTPSDEACPDFFRITSPYGSEALRESVPQAAAYIRPRVERRGAPSRDVR